MTEKVYFGLTQEQATELNNYFLEKPAKEAIPYLKIIQNLPQITVKVEDEKPAEDSDTVEDEKPAAV